ncbi:MAG: hypothetical protein P4L71_01030 [Acetobacteraceae bacterium]|nr:hypothetical protein [Acetobacteraceae bacterium]
MKYRRQLRGAAMQSAEAFAASWRGIGTSHRVRPATLALGGALLMALMLRVAAFRSQIYVIYPDETFQYLEQAHRLAFGSGVVPWEYFVGVRSWLVPGVLAGLFRVASWFTDSPLAFVQLARFGCSVVSLAVVFVGFRLAERHFGTWAAMLTGGLCAVWGELIWFAPTVMPEVLSAHFALLALWCGESGRRRSLLLTGFGLGLAACLRFQYAPALFAAALWQHRLDWQRWRLVLCGGAAAILPVAGLLDWVTLGTPFQSIWLNYIVNSKDGVASSMGTVAAWFFPSYLSVAFSPVALLVPLVVVGAFRAPALAITATVVVALHSLVPHKEIRFIYLATAVMPILIGLGAAEVLHRLARQRLRQIAWPATAILLVGAAALSWQTAFTGVMAPRWQYHRATIEAVLAAHAAPDLCGLASRDELTIGSAGYAYLHRDVPLILGYLPPERHLPGSDLPMRSAIILDGRPVPQVPSGQLTENAKRFNYLLAEDGDTEPGYAVVGCFDDVARTLDGRRALCLLKRPGGCALP